MRDITLIFFKPNIIEKNEEEKAISKFFGDMALVRYSLRRYPEKFFKEFYGHVPESSLTQHAKFCSSGRIGIAILEGKNAIKKVRKIIGSTDSSKASPKTLRGYYFRKYKPKNGYDNFIHASKNKRAVKREMKAIGIKIH